MEGDNWIVGDKSSAFHRCLACSFPVVKLDEVVGFSRLLGAFQPSNRRPSPPPGKEAKYARRESE